MAKNQNVDNNTQVGIVNGTTEGYSSQSDFAASLADKFPNGSIPVASVLGIPDADDDVASVTFTVAAGGNLQIGVTEGGVTTNGALNVTALATALAASPSAMQTLASAILSADAANSAILGSDGLIYENDAV